MAAIGSGINPALGRVDYSPFLQGAQMAAQGRMQGSNALAEGVSQGFQDYLKKREQNAILEGKNNALLRDISQNPQLAASPEIQKYTAKMAKGGPLTLNDNIKLNAELTTTVEAVKNRQEEQRQQAYLKLQQDSAAINAERAAREKAEYTRRNTFQENIIRLARENPEVLKDPTMSVRAVLDAGGNLEDAQRIQGNAITQQQFELEKTQRQMDFSKRSLELAEAARRGEVTGKEPDVKVFEQNGVKMVVLLDALKQPIGQPHVVAQGKPSVGEKTQRNALEYHIAEQRGDTAGMQRAMIDIMADNPEATRGLSQQEVRQNFILPFVPRTGGEVAPTEPLKVTGAPKPLPASPAPSPEAARITQSPNPAPSATPPTLGRTFAPMANAAPFEAPSPMAAAAPAPQPAPAPAPGIQYPPVQDIVIPQDTRPPAPGIQYPPVQDIVIPQDTRPPVQDIILDESLLRKPPTMGRMFSPAGADKNQPPEITETMLRKAARERPIEPGQKNIGATQLERLMEEREAAAPAKIRQSALKLLELKKGDSPDTRAIKQIIPYLNNQALADKLLKELSENKEPKLSSLEKDRFARSMFNAAKEGRLPQLNMAAGRGF